MQSYTAGRHNRHSGARITRLLLAMLMAVLPPLPVAQAQAASPGVGNTAELARPQMPCHGADQSAAAAEQPPACPHCATDAPATACQCCSYAGPAGLAVVVIGPLVRAGTHRPPTPIRSEALPESVAGRLFRPPIDPS